MGVLLEPVRTTFSWTRGEETVELIAVAAEMALTNCLVVKGVGLLCLSTSTPESLPSELGGSMKSANSLLSTLLFHYEPS